MLMTTAHTIHLIDPEINSRTRKQTHTTDGVGFFNTKPYQNIMLIYSIGLISS